MRKEMKSVEIVNGASGRHEDALALQLVGKEHWLGMVRADDQMEGKACERKERSVRSMSLSESAECKNDGNSDV